MHEFYLKISLISLSIDLEVWPVQQQALTCVCTAIAVTYRHLYCLRAHPLLYMEKTRLENIPNAGTRMRFAIVPNTEDEPFDSIHQFPEMYFSLLPRKGFVILFLIVNILWMYAQWNVNEWNTLYFPLCHMDEVFYSSL